MDPTLKNRTLTSLKEKMPMLSPRLRIVAKYIVDHLSDFGLDSIRETARKSGVSTYSLVRAANSLGFESYDQLREPFRHVSYVAPAADAVIAGLGVAGYEHGLEILVRKLGENA